jgi:hypothetical protein
VAFNEIKWALTNTPALGLPNMMKPFFLYVHERLGVDSCGSLDPAASFLTPHGNQLIKATLCSFLRLATLPAHPGRHYCLGG